jgi:hypothetical protein
MNHKLENKEFDEEDFFVSPTVRVVLTKQRVNTRVNTAFSLTALVDAWGQTVTGDRSSQVSLGFSPGGNAGGSTANVTCAANSVSVSAGVATFGKCKVKVIANGYQLQVSSSGVASSTSNYSNITKELPAGAAAAREQEGEDAADHGGDPQPGEQPDRPARVVVARAGARGGGRRAGCRGAVRGHGVLRLPVVLPRDGVALVDRHGCRPVAEVHDRDGAVGRERARRADRRDQGGRANEGDATGGGHGRLSRTVPRSG